MLEQYSRTVSLTRYGAKYFVYCLETESYRCFSAVLDVPCPAGRQSITVLRFTRIRGSLRHVESLCAEAVRRYVTKNCTILDFV